MNPYYNWINYYSNIYGVDPELAKRIAIRESNFNPRAVSPSGAIGIMQLMPGTAKGLGIDPYNPEENIKGGIKYYADMKKKYGPIMGLAAYNWGPGNVNQYLSGKKKMPEETENYLAALGQYADPSYAHSPMDLQGRSGVMPEMLPVSNPTPQVTPQVSPQVETPKMDDYEQMKIFNPYVQLALGILAGNTGQNKSQAFANSMQGGLGALNAAQRSMAYESQVRAQNEALRMKRDEYNKMQERAKYMQEYAKKRLADPNLDPDERIMWELGQQGDLDSGIKLMSSITGSRDKAAMRDLQLQTLMARKEALEAKQSGGIYNPVTVPEGHPLSGWTTKEGKLYDPRGIEVTGDKRNWATDISTLPPEEANKVPYLSYKDKNNPNRIVNPTNFSNWIDKEGNYLTEALPVEDVVNKGYRYVDDKERADYRAAKAQLDQIATQWENLFGEAGVYKKAAGLKGNDLERFISGIGTNIAGTGLGNDETSIKIREFNKFVDRTLPSYAREVGHVGVLTQQDVDSVKPSIGMITPEYTKGKFFPDTEKEVKQGLKNLVNLYRARGIVNSKLEKMMQEMEESEASTSPNIWDNTPVGVFENGIRVYRK